MEKTLQTRVLPVDLKDELKKLSCSFEYIKNTAKENARREKVIAADMTIKLDEITTLVSEKRSIQENINICSFDKFKTSNNLNYH